MLFVVIDGKSDWHLLSDDMMNSLLVFLFDDILQMLKFKRWKIKLERFVGGNNFTLSIGFKGIWFR